MVKRADCFGQSPLKQGVQIKAIPNWNGFYCGVDDTALISA